MDACWGRRLRRGSALMAVGLAAGGGVTAAHADDFNASYTAHASAVGIVASADNPSTPAGLQIIGGGSEAEVTQNSLQGRSAAAYFPYVGNTIPGAYGLLGGALGLPTFTYPLAATTDYGDRPQDVDYPGISLHAESLALDTIARATAGSEGSGSSSWAQVDQDADGTVTAKASSVSEPLHLGTIAVVSGAKSTAVTTVDQTGVIHRTAHTSIAEISVPGASITIPPSTPSSIPVPMPIPGVPNIPPLSVPPIPLGPFGGQTLPAPDIGFEDGYFTITLPYAGSPQRFAIPANSVLPVLKAAGITMTYQAPQETKTGVIAGVVTMTTTLPSPPDNEYFSGPTPTTFTLGGTVATVDLHPAGGVPLVGGTPAGSFTSGVIDGIVPPAAGASTGGTSVPGLGASGPSVPAPMVAPPGSLQASGPQPAVVAPEVALASAAGGKGLLGSSLLDLYLMFVAIALIAFVAANAVRLLGVRSQWSS